MVEDYVPPPFTPPAEEKENPMEAFWAGLPATTRPEACLRRHGLVE